MKITLIGASGFVGTRLITLLKKAQRYEMLNIDLQQSRFFPEVTAIGDVRDQDYLDKKLEGAECVVLLAAQHRDDVVPVSLYYDTNVGGIEKTLKAMEKNNIKRIIFFSSVAVYGLNKKNPNEEYPADPFNHYGKSKWQAEQILHEWYKLHPDWNIDIIRPTVIFGERNRGNVYNLLKQIASGKFLMIGSGNNKKSMAYVGNIVEFIKFKLTNVKPGYDVYNYVDKPDLNMNQLVSEVEKSLSKKIPSVHLPYPLGMLGGYCFDILSKVTGKKYAISSVRVKKFCATTQFDATKVHSSGFKAPYTLSQGLDRTLKYEFVHEKKDDITFVSE